MPRKTRKYKQRGGDFLGEGAHGKVYNTGCSAGESLCSILSKSTVESIVIFTEDKRIILKEDEQADFLDFIRTVKESIVKIFKPSKKIVAKLDKEIHLNRLIAEQYGKDAAFFTTIAPLDFVTSDKGIKYKLFGARIDLKGKEPQYVVCGAKCSGKFNLEMKRCLIDIASSLIVLHQKHWTHNDIKFDNIVKCDDMYKLIDWGAATPMDFKALNHGSLLTTSPLRWYLLNYPAWISSSILGTKTALYRKDISKFPFFQELLVRINSEFYEIVKKGETREALFEKYKETMDIFMLGMTALHGVIERKLDLDTYKPVIEALTSFTKPLDAKGALRIVSRLED